MGENRYTCMDMVGGKLKEIGHLKDLGIYRRIILKSTGKICLVEQYVFHILLKVVTSPVHFVLLHLITSVMY